MKNGTTFSGLDPLTLRISGSGEYVKNEVAHLVDLFDFAEFDFKQELSQDGQIYE